MFVIPLWITEWFILKAGYTIDLRVDTWFATSQFQISILSDKILVYTKKIYVLIYGKIISVKVSIKFKIFFIIVNDIKNCISFLVFKMHFQIWRVKLCVILLPFAAMDCICTGLVYRLLRFLILIIQAHTSINYYFLIN